MDGTQTERARTVFDRALSFAESLGTETYDPFDIKGCPIVLWSFQSRSPVRRIIRQAMYGLELFAPIPLRKLLNIPKRATAGGIGRMAQAEMAAYRLTNEDHRIEKAKLLLTWLLENPGLSTKGLGWGVPFEWATYFGQVPAHQAVSHTTQACGHAFLDFHDLTGQSWALDAALQCCDFLTHDLNQKVNSSGSISLSYTPFDTSQVINISAECAGYLLRAARPSDLPLVWKLGQFVVETQSADGSFPYSAPGSSQESNPVDHYHTGMVLNGLLALSADPDCQQAFRSGLQFHLQTHFLSNGAPRMRPESTYPIDSYSAGESVLLLTQALRSHVLEQESKQAVQQSINLLVDYLISNMSYPDGGFCYRKYRVKTMRIDSLRWSQALLCHGLAEFLILQTDAVTSS